MLGLDHTLLSRLSSKAVELSRATGTLALASQHQPLPELPLGLLPAKRPTSKA
jgi:hypothetical protein